MNSVFWWILNLWSRAGLASVNNQLATAEVAARVLALAGETVNANLLDLWFDVFNFQYQKGVCQRNKGNVDAISNYEKFLNQLAE